MLASSGRARDAGIRISMGGRWKTGPHPEVAGRRLGLP